MLQVVPVAGAMKLPNITSYHPGVNITAQYTAARDDPNRTLVLIPEYP